MHIWNEFLITVTVYSTATTSITEDHHWSACIPRRNVSTISTYTHTHTAQLTNAVLTSPSLLYSACVGGVLRMTVLYRAYLSNNPRADPTCKFSR